MEQRQKAKLKCFQINLQHSWAATDNLMQIISSENIDIAFVQEPYVHQNRIKGITGNYRIYAYGKERSRAAIIIPNDTIDALMITQCSDKNIVLLEIKVGQATFYTASAYMDYKDAIVNSFKKIERILEFTKGAKIILAKIATQDQLHGMTLQQMNEEESWKNSLQAISYT
jgi:hypothetical protein